MPYSDTDPDVQRVRYEVRRFRQHFITFVAVIGVLFLVNLVTGGFWFGHWWFFWIALIWGVILALEAAHLFGDDIGREWEDRMVDQVVARRRRQAAGTSYRYTPPPPPGTGAAGPAGATATPPASPGPLAPTPNAGPPGPEVAPPSVI
jgi:hypothetical protein